MFVRVAVLFSLAFGLPAVAQDTARYRLDIRYDWSSPTHPFEFPENAHMARVFGVTHSERYTLFADGLTASGGLELMAENGRDTILRAEWAEAKRRKRIGSTFEGPGVGVLPGGVSIEFETHQDAPLLSFAAMLAPSPDWFTGLAGVPLHTRTGWTDRIEASLWAWDSGTDSGATYAAPNVDTNPRASVRLLASPHVLVDKGLVAIGSAVLTRID
ncbi:MAG: spondin domain-containing protein [Pseudomonadota bacterium]